MGQRNNLIFIYGIQDSRNHVELLENTVIKRSIRAHPLFIADNNNFYAESLFDKMARHHQAIAAIVSRTRNNESLLGRVTAEK